jgi:bacteriocin biosynthesis cyclodehydratase domain-containing protein
MDGHSRPDTSLYVGPRQLVSLPPDVRPRLPGHLDVVSTPPDSSGEEELSFISGRRRITIRGTGLRVLHHVLLPLIDGTRTVDDLIHGSATGFSAEELERCLTLLAATNLLTLERHDDPSATVRDDRLAPQLGFFHEMEASGEETQRKLRNATVAVVGVGGVGAHAALALAASPGGRIRCADDVPVRQADPYLAPVFAGAEPGRNRAMALKERLEELGTEVVASAAQDLASEESVRAAVRGTDFVICGLDLDRSGTLYRVNHACLRENVSWTVGSLAGIEAVLGPTVLPGKTACYVCYRMRAIACSASPVAELAMERTRNIRNRDESSCRENLTFAAGALGNLTALEAFKAITGIGACSVPGAIAVLDLLRGSWQKHTILRKPWCPACRPGPAPSAHGDVPR